MPTLRIGVLGPLDIRHGNCVALAFESFKARALLVYLAVESSQMHSRETIAGMFWPDRPDSAALANLRHTLASVRTTLGERLPEHEGGNHSFFTVSPTTIQFSHGSSVSLDLSEFEQHLAAAEHEQEPEKRIAHLKAAVQLYRGPFMQGFSVSGCPEFDDWILLRRENILLELHKALRNLADAQLSSGDLEQGLSTLQHLLQLDPWNESIHRKVMALLASQGQRSAALLQYERCRKLLLDELGVNPEDETIHLYEKIRVGAFADHASRYSGKRLKTLTDHASKETPSPPFFVGRTLELARLHHALKLALRGRGQLVFITGEAGSGKTSLALEFVHQAMEQQADLLVAAGRCSAITGFERAFLPFREVLQMLIGGNGTLSGRMLTPEHRRRLAEFLPETMKSLLAGGSNLIDSLIPREVLLQRIEMCGPAGRVWQPKVKQIFSMVADRSGLDPLALNPHEAITRMLSELACRRPLVLFIDDLQWADAGSISLLHYLCKRLDDSQILILSAFRPQDLATSRQDSGMARERHPFERVRLELQRELGEIEICLDHSEGMEFINALIDREPNCLARSFRQMLFDHTAGIPLFAVELLRSMRERGNLTLDATGRWVEGTPFDWEKLPPQVEAVIAERIGRLPPAQQMLLRAASVEGEIFTAEVAARVLGLEERQVVSWLSGPLSQEQRIVDALNVEQVERASHNRSAHLSHYRFRHVLLQKYIYNHIDAVERSTFHEATGSALELLSRPDTVDRTLRFAWHFEQGRLVSRAVEYLISAAKQAEGLSAYKQAKEIYDRCLTLIQQIPSSHERDRLENEINLAGQLPVPVTSGGGYNAGVEQIYQSLGYMMAGEVHFFSGRPVPATEFFEQAIYHYRKEDQDALVHLAGYSVLESCLTWCAWSHWIQGHPGRSEALSQEAIAVARKEARPFYLAMSIAIAGALLSAIKNEPEQARAYAQECLSLADAKSVQFASILSKTVLGWAMVKQGEIDPGFAWLEQGIAEWGAAGDPALQPIQMMLFADALSITGQTGAGLRAVATAVELIEQTGRRLLEANVYWLQGEILDRERRRSGRDWLAGLQPAECFDRAITIARQQQARALELRATTGLARLLIEGGRTDEAMSRLNGMLRQFDEGFDGSDLRAARELLAAASIRG